MELRRTHTLSELIAAPVGTSATLMGWVHHRRDLGQLIFITLRDRDAELQCVFDPESHPESHAVAGELRGEYVVAFSGSTRARPEKEVRPYPGGDREFVVERAVVLNTSETPPFVIEDDVKAGEELRLRYRYLDLRRRPMIAALTMRHRAIAAIRSYLNAAGFLEVETPLLARSTPEGARDYVVPSRVHPGSFFALPQSPQLFKQILMVSGVERYYQIAKCLRDEDLRGNRQPEHTQLDLEMSFATRDELFELHEGCMAAVWRECLSAELPTPFPRLTYAEAMDRFGTDKPDLRIKDMEIKDLTELWHSSEASFINEALENGARVHGIFVQDTDFARSRVKELTDQFREAGCQTLMTLTLASEERPMIQGSVNKFVSDERPFRNRMGRYSSGTWVMALGPERTNQRALGQLRTELAKAFGNLSNQGAFAWVWVVDFPLYERGDDGGVQSGHNPFSMPTAHDAYKLDSEDPEALLTILADNYDLVLNGVEMSSGSLRIHNPDLQRLVFRRMGMSDAVIDEQFGWFIEAYRYGAPPHRGFGQGIDRLIMSLVGTDNIRDVIAFPKTATAQDLLTGAPSRIDATQLRELKLKLEE